MAQLLILPDELIEFVECTLIVGLVSLILLPDLPGVALQEFNFILESLGELFEFGVLSPEGVLPTNLLSQLFYLYLIGVAIEGVSLNLSEP